MKIIKIERLDRFDGNVVAGTPQPGDIVRLTYDNGTIREKRVPVEAQEPQQDYIFLHGEVSKAGIRNDGIDSVTVSLTFRQTASPTSNVIEQIDGIERVIPIRDSRGIEYDLVKVAVNSGVVSFNYTSQARGATVHIDRADVELKVGGRQIVLVSEPEFIVYRDFT